MEPEDLLIERRAAFLGAASAVKWYVLLVFGLAFLTVSAVVTLSILAPNNPGAITTVIGITSPIFVSLLGGGLYKMAVGTDGKLNQILRITAEKERARGIIEGLKQNPDTNIS